MRSLRLFDSLGDLSADLRLDDVLDKITTTAQVAAGGKDFALLLTNGATCALTATPASRTCPCGCSSPGPWAPAASSPAGADRARRPLGRPGARPDGGRPRGAAGLAVRRAASCSARRCSACSSRWRTARPSSCPTTPLRWAPTRHRLRSPCPTRGSSSGSSARPPRTRSPALPTSRSFHIACGHELSRSARDGRPLAIVAAGPRPLQGDQRRPRPPLRRRGAATPPPRAALGACARTTPLRAWAARSSRCCCRTRTPRSARAVAERARAAVGSVVVPGRPLTARPGVASHAGPHAALGGCSRTPTARSTRPRPPAATAPSSLRPGARRRPAPEPPPRGAARPPGAIVPASSRSSSSPRRADRLGGARALPRPRRPLAADVFAEAHRLGLGARLEVAACARR